MNVTALSNLSDPTIQSIISKTLASATSTTGASGATLPQDSTPQLSPFARAMSTLQQLQESDPAKYRQVTAQISTNLNNAAQQAAAQGNTSQAAKLSQLANDFKSASQNNTLPNPQDLAQAVGGAQGHRHGHGNHLHAAPSSVTDNRNGIFASLMEGSTSQNDAFDPLSIISSTLSSAGVQQSQ